MRKHYLSQKIVLVACGVMILMFSLFFTTRPGNEDCTADCERTPKIENLKDGDMLLESLSRQFIGTVSY